MRLFVAVNFDAAARAALAQWQAELRANALRGNFSALGNVHLTLAFLGERDAGQAAAASRALDAVAAPGAGFRPFDADIRSMGRFRRDGGDLWWAGMEGCAALDALHGSVWAALAREGFEPERGKWRPHVTLAREVSLRAGYEPPARRAPIPVRVESVELMLSERPGGRLTYTPLHSAKAEGA
jgi:2'-5' RNA ligase